MDRDEVRANASIGVWIELTNNSSNRLDGVGIAFVDMPGFEPPAADPCWNGRAPVCLRDRTTPAAAIALAAGESVVTSARLIRTASAAGGVPQGRVYVTARVQWRDGASTVTAGPVLLVADDWYASPVIGLVRDLAIPVSVPLLLAIVAFLTQRTLQRRAEIQAVWDSLLATSLGHSKKYYLPVAAAATLLLKEVGKDNAQGRHELIFSFLLFSRRMRALAKDLAGFHFKSKSGETAASHSWQLVHYWLLAVFDRALLEQCVGKLRTDTTFGDFRGKLDGDNKFRTDVELLKQQWLAYNMKRQASTSDLELLALDALIKVVEIEADRPFDRWYRPANSYLDRERLEKLLKLAASSRSGFETFEQRANAEEKELAQKFVRRLAAYLTELPVFRKLGLRDWISVERLWLAGRKSPG